jgi:hypothetical protein
MCEEAIEKERAPDLKEESKTDKKEETEQVRGDTPNLDKVMPEKEYCVCVFVCFDCFDCLENQRTELEERWQLFCCNVLFKEGQSRT